MRRMGVLALVVLAACGGDDPVAQDTTTTTPAETTTTAGGVTTEQVASVVASSGRDLEQRLDAEEDCTSTECLFVERLIERWSLIQQAALAFRLELRELAPPAEVEELLTDTMEALSGIERAHAAFESCLVQNAGGSIQSCDTESTGFQASLEEYRTVRAGWEPYL